MTLEEQNDLETLIDSHGLSGVLEALADICGEKADHVRTNWQDAALARLWSRDGARIQKVAANVHS